MSSIPLHLFHLTHLARLPHLLRLTVVRLWLGSLLLAWLLFGCGERATPTPLPDTQPTATAAVQQPVAGETAVANQVDQLVVWLPVFTGLATENSGGAILTNAFHQFEQRNPSITLDVHIKAETGTSSLFNFLRSAQQVAPTILPDLVLLNTQQLWQLVDLGIVVALSEDETLDTIPFFPVAQDAVQYRAETIGIPYTVDVIHLAYDGNVIETPPADWSEFVEAGRPLLFPAAEAAPTNATLLQYVGAGGTLLEDGTISDPEALEAFFTFLTEAREQKLIPLEVLDMPGYNAVWRAFSEDRSDLAAVQVAPFYPNLAGIAPPRYAPMPTRSGESVTIAETWAFAILTEDAQRRALALELVRDLLAPDVHGTWSQTVARPPTQPEAFALWTQTPEYRDFVQRLIDEAHAQPNGPAFADFARRLHAAQMGILRSELTVDAAIASMAAVEP